MLILICDIYNNIIFFKQPWYPEYRKFCFGYVIYFRIYRIMDCSPEVGVFKDGFSKVEPDKSQSSKTA